MLYVEKSWIRTSSSSSCSFSGSVRLRHTLVDEENYILPQTLPQFSRASVLRSHSLFLHYFEIESVSQ